MRIYIPLSLEINRSIRSSAIPENTEIKIKFRRGAEDWTGQDGTERFSPIATRTNVDQKARRGLFIVVFRRKCIDINRHNML